MKPLISIIVPIYNVENFLPQCLDSLVNQTMREIEIICVNDGSPDNSLTILKEYAERDDRIVVIDQPNFGVSIARNTALKHVKGEYYMFVDSDDWLDSETCAVVYNYAKQNNTDCLMFSYKKEFGSHSIVKHVFEEDLIVWEKEDVMLKFHRRLYGPIGKELTKPQDMDIMVTPCMQLFRTVKYSKIPFIDIREVGTFEDGLYQMEVYNDCDRFVYIDRPFYHYLKTNEASITTRYKADLSEKFQNLWNIMEKNIKRNNLGEVYQEALNNRVALSMIGLGLNEIHKQRGFMASLNGGGNLLNIGRMKESIKLLDISCMPIPWKVFFFLCKKRLTILLTAMLYLMEYIRTHHRQEHKNESETTPN